MFRRDPDPPVAESPTARPDDGAGRSRGRPLTLIASGSRVSGEISGGTEVLVEGEFEGGLNTESTVTVGRGGRVRGEISGRLVCIEGKVEGNVRGSEKVEVRSSGVLEGDIFATRVVIAEGAFFKGSVEMSKEAAKKVAGRDKAAEGKAEAEGPGSSQRNAGAKGDEAASLEEGK